MNYTIDSVGGDSDGAALANYQFVAVANSNPTKYNFCTPATLVNPTGTVVTTNPTSFTNGEKFSFDLAIGTPPVTYSWEIKDYNLGTATPGKWKNNHKAKLADDSDGESGTFQAQSGVEEEAKGKTAQA